MTGRGIGRAVVALAVAAASGYACALLHADSLDVGADVLAGISARRRRRPRRPGAGALRRTVDHRNLARPLFHAPGSPRSRGTLVSAGRRRRVLGCGWLCVGRCARAGGETERADEALFASVPGGAAEMAVLGERFGARVDRVAAAQSLRILIVVAVIPAVYTLLGVHGTDPYVQGAKSFVPAGLALLMGATAIGGFAFHRAHVPNAFVLGSLAVAIPLTAMQIDLSAMPQLASNAGQCLLGCALGSRFQRDFLQGAHRFVSAVLISVLLAIALSAAFGAGLAYVSGLHPATLVLGTAPGGHRRDVHYRQSAAAGRAAGHGVPRHTRRDPAAETTVPLFANVQRWWNADEGGS